MWNLLRSQKGQELSLTAAAMLVITQEDIRRSDSTNIPDLLRMVPGLNVAQIKSNVGPVSARGLNSEFSNKLLLVLDRQSVHSPTFSGVFSDVLDLPAEDSERLAVIRGPEETTWGGKAVDGVTNVIGKRLLRLTEHRSPWVQATSPRDSGPRSSEEMPTRVPTTAFSPSTSSQAICRDSRQNGGDAGHVLRAGFRKDGKFRR